MKKIKKVKIALLTIIAFSMAGAELAIHSINKKLDNHQDNFVAYGLEIPDEDTQYLGYGYDVTGGKAISDPDALNLAYPILDVNNPELIKYEKAFSASQTTYLNYTSKSTSEIASQYGMTLGGGVSGKIQMVTLNISSKFNTNTSFSKKFEEEYSYYSIYAKNRTVVLQAGSDTLSHYLNERFKEEAKAIATEQDANNFFDRYGTHLVTGYNLGGIFEMTNYYATSSSQYSRQMSMSFSSQVEAAFGAYGAGTDFSFSANFGSLDNNSYAVNNYKCTTYGGYTFPGLTIDQAFSYYETAFGAGYIYGLWTDSINAGKNLSIVSIPQSASMIPLFNLLPNTSDYSAARDWLVKTYIKKCGLSYREFLEKYPNINGSREPSTLDPLDIGYLGLGYECFENADTAGVYNSSYYSSDDYSNTITVPKNCLIAFDFEESVYYGRELEWISEDATSIPVIDKRSGVFSIPSDVSADTYTIRLELDGVQIYQVDLRIDNLKYSGGLGTEQSPYIISNKADLQSLMNTPSDWDKNYRLNNDITLDINSGTTKTIGYKYKDDSGISRPFTGSFDGAYHTIYNISICSENMQPNSKTYGLFGYNTGKITNLTLDTPDTAGETIIKNFSSDYNWTYAKANKGILDNNVKTAGFICGINDGTIRNCRVNNAQIELIVETDTTNNGFHAGIIAGQNGTNGSVQECFVNGCSIRTYSDKTTQVSIGGIAGSNLNKDATLAHCSVVDSTLSIISDFNATVYLYAGMLCGTTRGDVEDCIITNSQVENIEDLPLNVSITSASTSGSSYVHASSAIALADGSEKQTFKRIFITNIKKMSSTRDGNNQQLNYYLSRSTSDVEFIDCYLEKDTTNTIKASKGANDVEGIYILSQVKWDNVSNILENDDHWDKDLYGYIVLVYNDLSPNDISFDFSKVKKTFYITNGVGEDFKTGEINIVSKTTTGEDVQINNYTVDASNYTANKDVPGTWEIRVTAARVTAKYQVRSIPVSVIGISAVKNSAVEVDYYEGDIFNPENLVVNRVYQSGVDTNNSLKYKYDPNITALELANRDYFEIENADRQLLAGLNVFEISYYDAVSKETYTSSYSVYAKKSTVNTISIPAPASGNYNFKLPVGTRDISANNLVGLKINVNLEVVNDIDARVSMTNPNQPHGFTINFDENSLKKNKLLITYEDVNLPSHEIDASEVEFICSTIHYGDNVIRVCYNGYLLDDSASFIVKGFYENVEEKFEEFSEIINNYANLTSIRDRYSALKRALVLKGELNSLSSDDVFIELCQQLDVLIEKYNQDVGQINNIMIDSTRVATGFYYDSLINNGAIAFPLIIAIVFIIL